jgi:hypothetical protein
MVSRVGYCFVPSAATKQSAQNPGVYCAKAGTGFAIRNGRKLLIESIFFA